MAESSGEIAGWIVAGGASLVAAVTLIRKMISGSNKDAATDSATTDVIELLRSEVQRLSEQNQRFSVLISNLQLEVIALRDENSRLLKTVTGDRNGKQAG